MKTLRESLSGNQVTRVFGILNGTCNYILTRMGNEGQPFEAVLADAQRAGYAEADPTFDIEGHDTAHKLAILTSLAFGTEISFDTDLSRGNFLDYARRYRGGRGTGLQDQAARRRLEDRERHRAARPSDHAAEP